MSTNLDDQIQRLCREIPAEKDSETMMKLVEQLNRLLDEKEAVKSNPHDAPIVVRNSEAQAPQDLSAGEAGSERRKSA
jgi:hypothetical protein